MLLSMTGFGNARREGENLSVAVEVRTVNNRYLKISTRCPESFFPLESRIEKVVRKSIARGTVNITLKTETASSSASHVIVDDVLQSYVTRLKSLAPAMGLRAPVDFSSLLSLPGVVVDTSGHALSPEAAWQLVEPALQEALDKLQTFRAAEGQSMLDELRANTVIVQEQLGRVIELAPEIVESYRDRVLERVRELVQKTDVSVEPADLIREVSIYSERVDINEETTRLRSHLDQFHAFLDDRISQGRKLDFLTQEMFREINTIGSKSNNVTAAHCVVEMKAAVEKIREILQNVE